HRTGAAGRGSARAWSRAGSTPPRWRTRCSPARAGAASGSSPTTRPSPTPASAGRRSPRTARRCSGTSAWSEASPAARSAGGDRGDQDQVLDGDLERAVGGVQPHGALGAVDGGAAAAVAHAVDEVDGPGRGAGLLVLGAGPVV